MSVSSSRRHFLAAGLALPAAGAAATQRTVPAPPMRLAFQAAPELRYRTLGKTGLKVTSVGFGCMITSDASVIEKAADLGINYFDTARGYQGGNNERMVGTALKGKRKSIVLSSKTHSRDKSGALRDLDTSLRELGTDYLDVWYLHGMSRPEQVTDDLVEAQQMAKKQGKIRFAGVSTHSGQQQLIPALARNSNIDVVLTAYNFTMDAGMNTAIEQAQKGGTGVVAMKVMAGGFRRIRPGSPLYGKFKQEGVMLAALKWVLKNPGVNTTVPSITDMDQLDENLKAMPVSFTEKDQKLLAGQLDFIRPLYCRMCGQCDGHCPQGLPVADILRYLAYAEGYGEFPLGRESFLALPAAVKSVRCDLCPTCSIQCPNGVRVTERLIRAQELFA
jgi:aryl-alcohol dehydrogenase-like predicted oxidoreductase